MWPTVLAAASRGALLGVVVADKMSATTTRPESGSPVTIDCMLLTAIPKPTGLELAGRVPAFL